MIATITPGTVGIGVAVASQPAPEPAPLPVPSPPVIPLEVPGDAEPCTSCGREALTMAIAERSHRQATADAQVLAQVAAAYAGSRS